MNFLKRLFPTRRWLSPIRKFPPACSFYYHSSADGLVEVHSQEQEVVIALGSNVGDRISNINKALEQMRKHGIGITRHSCLYETAPAYVTDQPQFLNAAIRAVTSLGPHELLKQLKQIEKDLGRTAGIRYGPRPIDLDILFYGRFRVNSDMLTIPHERIWERPFVLAPLVDLIGSTVDSDTVACWHSFGKDAEDLHGSWRKMGGESTIGKEGLRRVLPIANSLWNWSTRTSIMGILNLTPDSFSDGGMFQSVEAARAQARLMLSEGADIIDVGAQSTRPMAQRVSAQEELGRLIPVLEAILELPEMEGKLVSVDTFHSEVALEAVKKGAHLINDVSAGSLDDKMFAVVAGLKVPYIVMHMRGNPCTMQSENNLQYGDVCKEIADELSSRVEEAELSGIPAWRMIIDPGIGFSKSTEQNVDILVGLPDIREQLAKRSVAMSRIPILIGPSRKKFLGEICERPAAADRDAATVACVTAGIQGGANIVRVHNVKPNFDAATVCDAMTKSVGVQTALKLIHQHGSIDDILEKINKDRYSVPDDWLYKEAQLFFKEPPVFMQDEEPELNWIAPNEEGLITFLVEENGFNINRVKKAIEKVKADAERSIVDIPNSFSKSVAAKEKEGKCLLRSTRHAINPKMLFQGTHKTLPSKALGSLGFLSIDLALNNPQI